MNLLFLGLGAALNLQSPQTLTLEEALRIAGEGAFSVRLAQSSMERARQEWNAARGGLGPQIGLQARYTRFDKALTAEFGGGSVVIRPIDQKEGSLSLSMPIDISGNLSRGVEAAKHTFFSSRAELEAARNALRFEVRQAYFRVNQAKWGVAVAQDALASSKARLEVAKKRFEFGEIARVDVLRFETEVAQRESDLIAANNALALAKHGLNNVLGRPIETPFETEEVTDVAPEIASAERVVETALAHRPELESIRRQATALTKLREAEERGLEPSLSLSVVHGRNLDAQGFGATSGQTSGVLTLNVPVFDSNVTRARVRAARQSEEQAKIRLAQAELGVSLEVRQALKSLEDARSRVEVGKRQLAFAEETYRLATLRFEAGEGIPLEIIDAQTQLTQAKVAYYAASYDAWIAYARLQAAVGRDRWNSD